MSRRGFWLSLALFPLPLAAQETEVAVEPDAVPPPIEVPPPPVPGGAVPVPVLPENLEPGKVDLITPVPPPSIGYDNVLAAKPVLPENVNITNQGGVIEGNINGTMRLGGPIKVTGDNGMEVFADTATLDLQAKTILLEGEVAVFHGNTIQRGQSAVYHYERKFLDTSGLRSSIDPILLEAGRFNMVRSGERTAFIGYDAAVTTDDSQNPSYWVRSKKTVVYPGDRVVFHDLKLHAGGTPVLWLPYFSQPLNGQLGYIPRPGARSNWGAFLLNQYSVMLGGETDPLTGEKEDQWLLSRWHADIRTRRGLGVGLDLIDTRIEKSDEITGLSLYYLNDLDPQASRSGVPRGFVNEDRWRAELKHRIIPDFPDEGDWRLDINLTALSDEHFLEDFDSRSYRVDPQPDNTIGLYRRDDASLLSLYTRLRANEFYRADSRLPEIAFDKSRSPILDWPVHHEGSTSFGFLGEQASDFTKRSVIAPLSGMVAGDPQSLRLLNQLNGYERGLAARMINLPLGDPRRAELEKQLTSPSYTRFHTYQELSTQHMVGGFLSVSPQAGIGYTSYNDVEGPGESSNRLHSHLGVESSLKFSKDYSDIRNHSLGLDGILHVFQPYSQWSLVSTDDFSAFDPRIDRLTPTTRPRPLDPARFTAVDEMRSWNVVRMGARNQLMTRRDGQSHQWLLLDSYVDAFLDDPEGEREFSNFYNDATWQPLPWLGVEIESQFPIVSNGSGFQEYATKLHFTPNERWNFAVGHRWLDGHPILLDSNRFEFEAYVRLSENWGLGSRHIFEADDGTLEYQQYSLHRDFGTWVVGMGLSTRDNRLQNEYGLVFSLTLKDFPDVSLPLELQTE